jgi:hypothetical protein
MSILLNPLAINKNNIDSVYNSNYEQKIKKIEMQQATQNFSKPDYLKQFDELSFDNIADPVTSSMSHSTITGINTSLQRNLDFQR